MPLTPRLSCYVVGAESLLIQCGEVLLQNDFEILGIVSAQPAIVSWAAGRRLPRFQLDGEFANALASRSPDFLFSIANLAILPPEVVTAASKGTINFHDGPLPQYAGLYTTSWALLERQETHGVTWHYVEGGIDEGDILKQERFPLDRGETALTLNAKCYEAGLRTFADLVPELRAGTAVRTRQDLSLRRYYSLGKRPAAACAIAWDRPAAEIDALVRALDFGSYTNPLGLAKARRSGRWFAVGACEPGAPQSGTAPGTILSADGDSLTVAVAGGIGVAKHSPIGFGHYVWQLLLLNGLNAPGEFTH